MVTPLTDWCVTHKDKPPGDILYINGRLPSGEYVTTSRVEEIDGDVITTRSGSQYQLLTPQPEFVAWCRAQGCHVPEPGRPILIHERSET